MKIVFAVAVFGGLFGCILLLLRKALATLIFIISLVAVLIQMLYSLLMTNASEVMGPVAIIMPIVVIAIAAFLVWYSKRATSKGWLR